MKEPPRLFDNLDHVLPLVHAGRLGLMLDFDGTISHIVPSPEAASVSPAAVRALETLVDRVALACVISGRAVRQLSDKVGVEGVLYVGNHGAEYLQNVDLHVPPGAGRHRDRIQTVLDHLKATVDMPGLVWDDKYFSASVHYRTVPDPDQARRALASSMESAPGSGDLDVFWGKMLLEIRAPSGFDKGYAVRKLVRERELDTAVVVGDDVTDIDALAALRDLTLQGMVRGIGVAVLADGSPAKLGDNADYTVDGVEEVERLLDWLVSAVG